MPACKDSRGGTPLDRDREMFHICRTHDCKFAWSRNTDYLGLDKGPLAVLHVRRFPFTENTVAAVPLAAQPGPAAVAQTSLYSKKELDGAAILFSILCIRMKQWLSEISVIRDSGSAITFIFTAILGNPAIGFIAVGNGFVDGVTTFYWDAHLRWANWLTRGLVYVALFGTVEFVKKLYRYFPKSA